MVAVLTHLSQETVEMAEVGLFLEDFEIKAVQISICPSRIRNRRKPIGQSRVLGIYSTLQESSM